MRLLPRNCDLSPINHSMRVRRWNGACSNARRIDLLEVQCDRLMQFLMRVFLRCYRVFGVSNRSQRRRILRWFAARYSDLASAGAPIQVIEFYRGLARVFRTSYHCLLGEKHCALDCISDSRYESRVGLRLIASDPKKHRLVGPVITL